MDFSEHVIISGAASAAILAGGGTPIEAAAFSATGIFIDLDHFADYWRETGPNADIHRFLGYFENRCPLHLWLFLHGWEWPVLLLALSVACAWPAWVYGSALGWLTHLALDQRFNRLHPLAYFFSYRAKVGFKAELLYGDH